MTPQAKPSAAALRAADKTIKAIGDVFDHRPDVRIAEQRRIAAIIDAEFSSQLEALEALTAKWEISGRTVPTYAWQIHHNGGLVEAAKQLRAALAQIRGKG